MSRNSLSRQLNGKPVPDIKQTTMSLISRTGKTDSRERNRSNGPFFVNNIRYTNSAAKFWFGMIDEIINDFPECTEFELSAGSSEDLSPDQLFPEISLEKDIKRLLFADIEMEMQKTMNELDIIGPPAPVKIRLISQEKEIVCRELPLDVIDAEIFTCVVVWPLKWAEIPAQQWNNNLLEGSISMENRQLRLTYGIPFTVRRSDLSEGLFHRSICIRHSAMPYSGKANTTAP